MRFWVRGSTGKNWFPLDRMGKGRMVFGATEVSGSSLGSVASICNGDAVRGRPNNGREHNCERDASLKVEPLRA